MCGSESSIANHQMSLGTDDCDDDDDDDDEDDGGDDDDDAVSDYNDANKMIPEKLNSRTFNVRLSGSLTLTSIRSVNGFGQQNLPVL